MKRKRDPSGAIIKWKARLCAHGGMQVYGDTFWDTYSPVVTWSTVRLVMILALVLGWEMRSIDFILAFPQAQVRYLHETSKGYTRYVSKSEKELQ